MDNAVLNRVKKVGNFTMISSKLLRNKEIPNKLLGFLLKVLSLPDYWHFSMSGLKAICKEGKTAVQNAVNKLIDMGYLVRTQLLSNESIYNCFEYLSYFLSNFTQITPVSLLYQSAVFKAFSPKLLTVLGIVST